MPINPFTINKLQTTARGEARAKS
ncbi:hypothetical protein CCACVL1_02549 [Corchorus capsularis]|uniref:Uncharacterized protein n=1 Tax=Corchorus capsularis TaxID=210143 RepID=A0A1R3K7Z2_COCAP|nr:hypothetical protein CCACVL1_02549 [Corchorus capsularis]